MAKRQTRRSISVSRAAYEAFRAKCEADGVSMSSLVEAFIRSQCDVVVLAKAVTNEAIDADDLSAFRSVIATRPAVKLVPNLSAAMTRRNAQIQAERVRLAAAEASRRAEIAAAYERQSFDTPCRDPKCRIMALHPAHQESA